MNNLNKQRFQEVADQLFSFEPKDATPTSHFDIEPQYTLIARLPQTISNTIYAFACELQSRFPDHYYYSPEQYHLTIVPIPRSVEPIRAIELIAPIVEGWRLPITVHGLAANRFQASAVLYPKEESLVAQRVKLRAVLGIPDQNFTVHRPIWEELLWVNFMRFMVRPEKELLEFIKARAKETMGDFVVNNYELYEVATKTLDPVSSKLLHTFEID